MAICVDVPGGFGKPLADHTRVSVTKEEISRLTEGWEQGVQLLIQVGHFFAPNMYLIYLAYLERWRHCEMVGQPSPTPSTIRGRQGCLARGCGMFQLYYMFQLCY